ncbi:WG repeat-containing protein [Brevibacillus sp. NRS-1366]|uniref:WG repeat-containing protein n=1 Tax=Brevibacillus sp. NRS-1366 TaxID=3233899 RepID=UPI003D1DBEA7
MKRSLVLYLLFVICIILSSPIASAFSYTEAIPFKYQWVGDFHEGLAPASSKDYKYGFIDKSGTVVIPFVYEGAGDFNEGMAAVKKNGLWGFIDKKGKEVLPFRYKSAERPPSFSKGLAPVQTSNNKYGYIDVSGKFVIEPKYDEALAFSDGLAAVQIDKKWGYINLSGDIVVPLEYDGANNFSEGYGRVRKGTGVESKYGFFDKSGKIVLPIVYDDARDFHDGLASIGKLFWFDDVCNAAETCKRPGLKFGYIDKQGNEVIKSGSGAGADFINGLVLVSDSVGPSHTWQYKNRSGLPIVTVIGEEAREFSEGYAAIKRDGLWGFIAMPDSFNLAAPYVSTVYVNGSAKSFDAYTIGGNTYFKLRDLAYVLSGTSKQFDIGYSTKGITLTGGKPYTVAGGEMIRSDGKTKTYAPTASKVYKDGKEVAIAAYTINGYNYFKLRDVMKLFNIGVTYDDKTKNIRIDTSKRYIE